MPESIVWFAHKAMEVLAATDQRSGIRSRERGISLPLLTSLYGPKRRFNG